MNTELGVWMEDNHYTDLEDYLPSNEELVDIDPQSFALLNSMLDKEQSFTSWLYHNTFENDDCFDTTEYKLLSYIMLVWNNGFLVHTSDNIVADVLPHTTTIGDLEDYGFTKAQIKKASKDEAYANELWADSGAFHPVILNTEYDHPQNHTEDILISLLCYDRDTE